MAPTTTRARTAAKHTSIAEAAATVFLERGFDAVSMDAIAALAGVSKRTVYDHFGDKQQLFAAVVTSVVEQAQPILAALTSRLGSMTDPDRELADIAVTYAASVLRPEVVRLRRLAIQEAERFPDLARAYFEQAPQAALEALANGFRQLTRRGVLQLDDPAAAATHFAYLVLGPLVDEALFLPAKPPTRQRIAVTARRGAATFLRVYRSG